MPSTSDILAPLWQDKAVEMEGAFKAGQGTKREEAAAAVSLCLSKSGSCPNELTHDNILLCPAQP